MITYKWVNDRYLVMSSSVSLHKGDTNVGDIIFIIPSIIDGVEINDIPLIIRYTLPNGDTYTKEITDIDIEFQEKLNKYTLPISKSMTSISGDVEFDLRFEKYSDPTEGGTVVPDAGEVPELEFRISSRIAKLTILPNSNFYVIKEEEE